MGHASYKQLSIMSKKEAMLGIPKLVKVDNAVYGTCQLGKQARAHHHATLTTATARPLELLHSDLMVLIKLNLSYVRDISWLWWMTLPNSCGKFC